MIKRYAMVCKDDALSRTCAQQIQGALSGHLIDDENKPDLVMSIGGDGTMLDACHQYLDQLDTTLFVGVHTGTLGFYTDYDYQEWPILVDDIIRGAYTVDQRELLEISSEGKTFYALNEVRLEENHRTMVCDVYINQEYLERFRGNGLCVSTPSGSTAYNRSLGGSIVAASVPSLQLTEIAGIHHNAYRSLQSSLVLDGQARITLKPQKSNGMILGIDRLTIPFHHGEIEVLLANKCIRFARFRRISLAQRLRRAFISE